MKSHIILLLLSVFCYASTDARQLTDGITNVLSSHANQKMGDVTQDNHQTDTNESESCPSSDDIPGCRCTNYGSLELDCSQIENGITNVLSSHVNQKMGEVTQDNHQIETYESEDCPSSDDIPGCRCSTHYGSLELDCTHIESEEQLRQIFKAEFPIKNFDKFILHYYSKVKVLESYIFNGITFKEIIIINTELEVVEEHAFDGCYNTITFLNFSMNKIIFFPFEVLTNFPKLERFIIQTNKLSTIPADAFTGLTHLTKLDISINYAIIDGQFENLPSLKEIRLGFNTLPRTIPAGYINTGSTSLEMIQMQEDHIASVEPGAFDIVKGMRVVIMGNSMTIPDETTWRPILEEEGILSFGSLDCGCGIAWLFDTDHLVNQIAKPTFCIGSGEVVHHLDPSIFDDC